MDSTESEALLKDIHDLRTILIRVSTGQERIENAESSYIQVRARLSKSLRAAGIQDPNQFQSLWDWYGYWRSNGLSSYQSRREYVNALYKPVIDAIEKEANEGSDKEGKPFSVRYGYVDEQRQPEIRIREEAPQEVREKVINIAVKAGLDSDTVFDIASRIGKASWEFPDARWTRASSGVQIKHLIAEWEWYLVYDFIECLYEHMRRTSIEWPMEQDFEPMINDYFLAAGVGWKLQEGKIASRGSEAFETAIHRAAPALKEAGMETAQQEIHEALNDLSRRPKPDLTGAIQHAMAALECTARSVSGNPNPTLGKLLERHPGLVPKPLDTAIEKAWGYASESGRHLREGNTPSREEAELIVGLSVILATYLSRKT